MRIVELTEDRPGNPKVAVNTDNISYVAANGDKTIISWPSSDRSFSTLSIAEPYESVLRKFHEEGFSGGKKNVRAH